MSGRLDGGDQRVYRAALLENVHKSFGEQEVLKGIDLAVEEHEVVCLIGASGSGKSTLLRCVNLLEPIDEGRIVVDGREVTAPGVDVNAVPRGIGIVFQAFNLFPHMTVLANVTLGPRKALKLPREEAEQEALELLDRFGLAGRRDDYPDRLSGGQQQRVAILRALAMRPKLLLLDEVTSALDPELVGEVLSLVRELADGGMTMVVATHEMAFAREVANRVCFLDAGRILESGPPAEIFSAPKEPRTQQFLARIVAAGPPLSQRASVTLDSPRGRSGSRPFARATAPAKSWPATTESSGASSGIGGFGTGRRYCASGIAFAAGPLAISVAPASRIRAAASTTTSSVSSSVATAQTGKSGSSAATGPCARSVAVSGSAAIWQVSSSFSAISRAVANSGPRPIANMRPTEANGTAIAAASRSSSGSSCSSAPATQSSPSATSSPRPPSSRRTARARRVCSGTSSSRRPRARRRPRAGAPRRRPLPAPTARRS